MQLTNTLVVAAPIDALWDVLNDVERFAPHVPGFALTESEGDRHHGQMKVKLGAVTVHYDVEINIIERDATARTVRAVATGREKRGAGTMKANVTGALAERGDLTEATIVTDLDVTGRVAQFGRNILGEVAAKLLAQFARDLETKVLGGRDTPSPELGLVSAAVGEPIDLVGVAGGSVARRVVPIGLAVLFTAALLCRFFRSGDR